MLTGDIDIEPFIQRCRSTARLIRAGDIAIACFVLLFTLPLLLAVSLAIRLESRGSIIARLTVPGRSCRRVAALRFRTAVYEPLQARPANFEQPTKVGALLRYSRIEILPEFVNVLRGEYSILDANSRSPAFLQ